MIGWSLQFVPGEPYPPYETKTLAADLLALDLARPFLTPWQRSFLASVRPAGVRMTARQRLAVRRFAEAVTDWTDLPLPTELPFVAAHRAARLSLGLGRKRKGERLERKREAESPCPVCRTGATLKAWSDRGANVWFLCENRMCVRKI